jgi:hypothetical protein
MKTTIGFSRRQVGATSHAGSFLGVSRAFVSSRLPERSRGMTCTPRMDKSPNPDENEDPGARLGRFIHPDKKSVLGPSRETAGDALSGVHAMTD